MAVSLGSGAHARLLLSQRHDNLVGRIKSFVFSPKSHSFSSRCYYRAVVAEPGQVPKGWMPASFIGLSDAEIETKVEAYKKLNSHEKTRKKYVEMKDPEFRWCSHCNSFKPERTHHCRECNRCVLMMDHHCPWVSNCVGVENRKDFVQFLFYGTLSQAMAFGLLIARVVDWVRIAHRASLSSPPPIWQVILLAVDCVFLLPVCLAVGGLLWYQLSCIVENLTTIDEYIMERRARNARKLRIPYAWPYDLGFKRNWKAFFGSSPIQWFFPGMGPRRDGINFEKSEPIPMPPKLVKSP